MITIAIFDDDTTSIARTRTFVEQQAPKDAPFQILVADSLDELRSLMATTHIDILIADILMPDGQLSGIEVVQRLFPPASGTQVIYISGFLEQATEVYRTEHVYFLLKPLDPQKTADALARAFRTVRHTPPTLLRIKEGHRERLINVSTVHYIESDLHKVHVHCGPDTFSTYAKLEALQAQLPKTGFSRCHRSYLVSLAQVARLEENDLYLHDGTVLPVSRRRARQVQRDLLSFVSARH